MTKSQARLSSGPQAVAMPDNEEKMRQAILKAADKHEKVDIFLCKNSCHCQGNKFRAQDLRHKLISMMVGEFSTCEVNIDYNGKLRRATPEEYADIGG